jgi:hypothetical protein
MGWWVHGMGGLDALITLIPAVVFNLALLTTGIITFGSSKAQCNVLLVWFQRWPNQPARTCEYPSTSLVLASSLH